MDDNNTKVSGEMTAGEILHNARTTGHRKREISTIAKQLCIREDFLQALEECRYSEIPEVVYVLGFARNYAMELGLNPDEIVDKIKHELGLDVNKPEMEAEKIAESGYTGDSYFLPKLKKPNFNFRRVRSYIAANWKWLIVGLVALLVLIAAIIVSIATSGTKSSPHDSAVSEIVMPKFNKKVREQWGLENRSKARVVLQAVKDSYLRIADDKGKIIFGRGLVAGDVYYVPVGGKYKATFGNAGGIDVWVDGKLAPKIGGDNVRKTGISLNPASLMRAK